MLVTSRRSRAEADAVSLGSRLAGALVGYRVESDGDPGVVVGVPQAGKPPRPLVLVLGHGDCLRFVSVRRVAEVSSDERRVVVRSEEEQS